MSSGRIRCRNLVTRRFGCNGVFGILTAAAAFDVADDGGMAVQQVRVMIANSHNNLNTRNPLTARIVVYDLDFHPLIGVRMRVADVENGNLAICLVYVNAPKRMLPQSSAAVSASNRLR